ncbi:type 2 isopentenyl-diphosphate Delta-isomerase [Cohnella massiliensis]|uniref:type 2 isopentenyl-diphosphate Delta-isomerase n=1 Tax=Cohnella massiliensis TaxID=1816691 RepID=UPI0009BA57CA|nr:type 2 isopentenyl-diphosphate Delta-isomerase [Cohnella massiliensis]
MEEPNATERRKSQHIEICLNERVEGERITTGFERYRFRHQALPEIDYAAVRTDTEFLGRKLGAPFLISSMTGGTEQASNINRNLAVLAQTRGWAYGVGSMRAAIERPELMETFRVRRFAPDIPILANLGAVQLNYGFGYDECMRAAEKLEADALVLHLNSLQEAFQPEGNTDFRGLLKRIGELCRRLPFPVGVKEVGWGIAADVSERLADAGVAFLDVAGAGGTSWSQVEKHRSADPVARLAAEAFADWGIPTAECVREVRRQLPDIPLIASGGLANGVDAAKSLALGAHLAGFGRSLLLPAVTSPDMLSSLAERLERELRTAMFGIGAATIAELRATDRLASI